MSWLQTVKDRLFKSPEFVVCEKVILPPPHRRFCGREFQDDSYFLNSAKGEAQRLADHLDCRPGSRVLDIGCGQGRLAIGLQQTLGAIDYTGLDVDRKSIDWCRKFLGKDYPTYKFYHVDVANERYNRQGQPLEESFQFDLPSGQFDIIYLYSVFSHMYEAEIRRYLKDFNRLLKADGRIFFTTFVEENVEPFAVNPPNYALEAVSGPLHVVRFERKYLFDLLASYNFEVTKFDHGKEANGQSGIYLRKNK